MKPEYPHFLFTSAIIPKYAQERESEYCNSYHNILTFVPETNIQVIECYLPHNTNNPLERYASNIFYSNTHNSSINNKGVLEARALREFFVKNEVDDQQVCIKLTGRYYLMQLDFVDEAAKHDATYTTDNHNQAFFGCIAMRAGLFKEFLLGLDLESMERQMINIEFLAARYLEAKQAQGYDIKHMKPIHLWSKINNDVLVYW